VQRGFTEAELLLIKELTASDLTRQDVDTHLQTGSLRVRHVGTGRTVEEAIEIQETLREWGPMIAETLGGTWIANSRNETSIARLAIAGTGAMHFTSSVEPPVVNSLVAVIRLLDAAPHLCLGADVLMGRSWQVLSSDPTTGAGLPPERQHKDDLTTRVERLVKPYLSAPEQPPAHAKRVQAGGNLYACATIGAIVQGRKRKLPTTKVATPRSTATVSAVAKLIAGIFSAAVSPASGATPTRDEVAAAMLFVEARFADLGSDFSALFNQLAADLS
jgi:hypothetical protein